MCLSLKMLMSKALSHFRLMNGTYPERVVLYRDGVGEGQMKAVSQLEVEQINAAFLEIETENEIELCYIVVNKKTNTELYAQGVWEDDSYKNPVPGTVIDCHSDLTRATEFFLISQS